MIPGFNNYQHFATCVSSLLHGPPSTSAFFRGGFESKFQALCIFHCTLFKSIFLEKAFEKIMTIE